jgi:PAS domain S-box-containing protein
VQKGTVRALTFVVRAILEPGALLYVPLAAAAAWIAVLRGRLRDQTEIIRTQMLQEAALEERHRDLVEGVSDVVFQADLDGSLQAINLAAQAVTGYRRAELLASSLYDLMPEPEREPARRLLAGLAAGHDHDPSRPFETALVARDGRVVPLEMTVRLAHRDGRAVGFEGIARRASTGAPLDRASEPSGPAARRRRPSQLV